MKYAKNFRDANRVQRRIGEDVPDEHGYDDKTLAQYVQRGFIDGQDDTKQGEDDDPKKDDPKKDADPKKPDNTKPAKPDEKKG